MMLTPTAEKPTLFGALPREATLANRVSRQMEELIAQGGLPDGSKLPPERDLAAQFGVSRTVIREAVAALGARGLLDVQAGSGTVIKRPSVESIAQLLSLSLSPSGQSIEQFRETARALAMEAAGLAAERATEDDLDMLSRIGRQYDDIFSVTRDAGLIHVIGLAAHNDLLALLLDCALQLDAAPPPHPARTSRLLLDSIRKRDVKDARRAMRDLFDDPDALARATSKKERKG